jgi:hypothetical protein
MEEKRQQQLKKKKNYNASTECQGMDEDFALHSLVNKVNVVKQSKVRAREAPTAIEKEKEL